MFEHFKTGIVTPSQARIWPRLLPLLCFAACFIRFPGEWDNDTITQHAQMLAGSYRDWHPPVFAAFWRLVNQVWNGITDMAYTGSGVLYVIHAAALWGGLALLTRAAAPFFQSFTGGRQWRLLALLAFLLFFGLFEMVPMTRFIFKDTAMMAAYILALGLILNFPAQGRLKFALAAFCLLLLFYGTAVRHNAMFSLAPLLLLLALKLLPKTRKIILLPLCLVLWGALLSGIYFVNYTVLEAQREYSLQEIMFVDIWKLNYKTKTFDLPPLPAGESWDPLEQDVFLRFYNDRALYINSSFKYIREYYGGRDSLKLRYDYAAAPEDFDRLRRAWLDKIKSNPGKYLEIHKRIFTDLLREFSFMGLSGAWYFVAGLLALGFWLLRLARKRQPGQTAAPLLVTLSGLLYVGPYMAAIPDIQRRYLFWFFFGVFFGLCWLVADFTRKRRENRAAL